jgi:hypothetical protein
VRNSCDGGPSLRAPGRPRPGCQRSVERPCPRAGPAGAEHGRRERARHRGSPHAAAPDGIPQSSASGSTPDPSGSETSCGFGDEWRDEGPGSYAPACFGALVPRPKTGPEKAILHW